MSKDYQSYVSYNQAIDMIVLISCIAFAILLLLIAHSVCWSLFIFVIPLFFMGIKTKDEWKDNEVEVETKAVTVIKHMEVKPTAFVSHKVCTKCGIYLNGTTEPNYLFCLNCGDLKEVVEHAL